MRRRSESLVFVRKLIIFLAFNIAVVVGALVSGPNPNIIQVIEAGD
jgi:hypothetical protein